MGLKIERLHDLFRNLPACSTRKALTHSPVFVTVPPMQASIVSKVRNSWAAQNLIMPERYYSRAEFVGQLIDNLLTLK